MNVERSGGSLLDAEREGLRNNGEFPGVQAVRDVAA